MYPHDDVVLRELGGVIWIQIASAIVLLLPPVANSERPQSPNGRQTIFFLKSLLLNFSGETKTFV
jgi:hypothetical protein